MGLTTGGASCFVDALIDSIDPSSYVRHGTSLYVLI